MKAKDILLDLKSIRTRFGLITGSGLLILLLVFYLGGRYILVNMIRDAEKSIQLIGSEVKNIVYNEVGDLQKATVQIAKGLTQTKDGDVGKYLLSKIDPLSAKMPINLLIWLGKDGSFRQGYFRLTDMPMENIVQQDILSYLDNLPLLLNPPQTEHVISGVIAFRNSPFFIAVTPIRQSNGDLTGFLMAGSRFTTPTILSRINQVTHGMQVRVVDRPQKTFKKNQTSSIQENDKLAPIFNSAMNYSAGGMWHFGENAFEAVIPLQDILGRQVTTISIQLPQSFSSLAQIALGWLTFFVASVGIVFIIPVFWFQGRIILNPLARMSEQIRRISNSNFDNTCQKITWTHNDEFGMLAKSVNHMLDTLVLKKQQVGLIEQRQRALIAGMPDGLCVFDADGCLVAVHKQPDYAYPIPGLVAGHQLKSTAFQERDCVALRQAISSSLESGKVQVVQLNCHSTAHGQRQFETRVCRMESSLALVIFRDITAELNEREARLQMEERLVKIQKMESLGNLAAGIAHDFNNILSIIQNTVDVAWEKPNRETQEAIDTISQATGKGAHLTRELMTYAGQTRISFKHEDPNKLIMDLDKLMGGVVAANVSIELKLTPDLPQVNTDPQQFWKVLINLLKNASESMNGARGHICISTYSMALTETNLSAFFSTQSLTPGEGVIFQIDDTGSGIPNEMISHLFEPFFSTKSVGRGLGLATVFAIVDAHSGGVSITSEMGKGSTFKVWLPTITSKEQKMIPNPLEAAHTKTQTVVVDQSTQEVTREEAPEKRTPCVLLIDDDKAILMSTALALRSLNVEILTASNKHEALTIFRKHAETISLVLLDAHIGHLDNVRLLATLRLRNPNVPIVVISGYNEKRIREMFDSDYYEEFLGKPYTRDELKAILDRYTTV